jgi:hypothetical protein
LAAERAGITFDLATPKPPDAGADDASPGTAPADSGGASP